MIKAEVRFTEQHFKALKTTQKTSWFTYFCGFFLFAMLALLVVSNIYNDGFSLESIKPLIIWFIILMLFIWINAKSPKKQLVNYQKNFPNAVNTYCFDDEGFTMSSVSDGSSSTSDHVYEIVEFADEKNGFFLLRQHRTKIVRQMRSQIFRQIVQKFCRHTDVCQEIFVQDDGKYASR